MSEKTTATTTTTITLTTLGLLEAINAWYPPNNEVHTGPTMENVIAALRQKLESRKRTVEVFLGELTTPGSEIDSKYRHNLEWLVAYNEERITELKSLLEQIES